MMAESQLKEKLLALAQADYQISESDDLDALLQAMIVHIGALDPELRDDLIYTTFFQLIHRQQALTPQQLRRLLQQVLDDEHLFCGIGEQGTDSVFTRAFSVLLLPLLLIAHRRRAYLGAEEITEVQEKLLRFMREEQDRRGFVEGKGWAHAIAHGADALDDLAQCVEVGADGLREILMAVQTAVCIQDTVYTHGEEERLVTPVIALLRRGLLAEQEIVRWVEGFADTVTVVEGMPQRMYIQGNVANFLQSLYFRLTWAQLLGAEGEAITGTLRKLNRLAGD